MKLREWLDAEKGRAPRLARDTGISLSAICKYKTGERRPILAHALRIRDATAGEVGVDDWQPAEGVPEPVA